MSAELLRETAALMRKRAEAAQRDYFSSGPWKATVFDDGRAWVTPARISMHGYPNTAEHIASWHPAVALAVADWLEAEAASHNVEVVGLFPSACCRMSQALAVARAYLGRDA